MVITNENLSRQFIPDVIRTFQNTKLRTIGLCDRNRKKKHIRNQVHVKMRLSGLCTMVTGNPCWLEFALKLVKTFYADFRLLFISKSEICSVFKFRKLIQNMCLGNASSFLNCVKPNSWIFDTLLYMISGFLVEKLNTCVVVRVIMYPESKCLNESRFVIKPTWNYGMLMYIR